MNKTGRNFLVLLIISGVFNGFEALALKPVQSERFGLIAQTASVKPTIESAWNLYGQSQYVASADAFEKLIVSSTPAARLYYCAGLANREAKRPGRARQLFDYVTTNFPQSAEAVCCQTAVQHMTVPLAIGEAVTAASPTAALSTPTTGAIQPAESAVLVIAKERKKGAYVFTAAQIASEGANGIDQTNAPNCWFESSMSALAALPKGQRLIASMIRYGDGDKYIVRFPGDGVEYQITEAELAASGVKNHALWASLLDYAQRKKFPDNRGAEGAYADQSRLEVGLASITGCKAEVIRPGQCGLDEIASFIGGAVRSQNPVVAGTARRNASGYQPIIEGHAYTIIGLDTAKNMIILRNPHGRKSRRFELPSDPQHLRFEQLEDGMFKMSIQTFHDSFGSAARSFI